MPKSPRYLYTYLALLGLTTAMWLSPPVASVYAQAVLSPNVATTEAVTAATPAMLNPGFETAGTATTQAASWQPFGTGYTRVSGGAHAGSWSIRATNTNKTQLAGAWQRVDFNQTSIKPVFVGAFVKGTSITRAANSWLGASIYAEIHLQNGSVVYWNSVPNDGTFAWRWIGFNTGTVASVNQPISYILVVPTLSNASGVAYFDDIQASEYAPTQAAVTLMFDDGETTTVSQAKPILDSFKFKGASAVITDYVGDDEHQFMTWAEIKSLVSAGWEIVSHSVNHEDMTLMTAAQASNELTASKAAFTAQKITVNNFAFPFGAYNANLLGLAAQQYQSTRAFELGDNPQGAFPYDIKVRKVISTTTPAEVSGWLTDAKNNKRWEVIVFHTIAATGDDEYHTSPAALRTIAQAVASSGIQVVTYQQGLHLFAVNR